jgi:hypothetical protein
MNHDQLQACVKQYLEQLEEKRLNLLLQHDTIRNDMQHYTPELLYLIENLVRKYALYVANIYFDIIITLIKHDYLDRFLQLQYWREKPTHLQVSSMDSV